MGRSWSAYPAVLTMGALLAVGCGTVTDVSGADGGSADATPRDRDGAVDGGGNSDSGSGQTASPENSKIYGEGGAIADGVETAEVTIELLDEAGSPVVGVTPMFRASGEGNSYEPCSASDADGVATCGMTSTEAGEKTLELTEPVQTTGDTIAFLLPCDEEGEPFGGGAGATDDPYRLCAAAHIDAIGADTGVWGRAFVVARDIDMAGVDVNAIGTFTGNFDGGGFALRNLTIARSGEFVVGLFGTLDEGGEIRDIILEGADVTGRSSVGALAGVNKGAIVGSRATGEVTGESAEIGGLVGWNQGTITDASAAVAVTGGSFNAGGLVGFNQGPITQSSASGDVSAADDSVGGLVGNNEAAISDSHASGTVTCEAEACEFVGGLVGQNYESTVSDSHATGEVIAGGTDVGGLIGLQSSNGTIERSFAAGNVTADGDHVGGLVGQNSGTITECYASGNVAGGGTGTGGLVGLLNVTVRDSYATGKVSGLDRVGGLVGENSGTLIDSYSAGEVVDDGTDIGGLVGRDLNSVIDAYWDTETSQLDTSDGGEPLTTADFSDAQTFDGWNFSIVWNIGVSPDGNQRPILQWQD